MAGALTSDFPFITRFWRRAAARLAALAMALNALGPAISAAREALVAPSMSAMERGASHDIDISHGVAHGHDTSRAGHGAAHESTKPPEEIAVSDAVLSDGPAPCDCCTLGGCVFCSLHSGSFAASRPASGLIFDPGASFEPPTLFVRAPSTHSAWLTPQPRAPPPVS